MDRQTLSHYGWIVIVALVLAVMLALSTPFGKYVMDGVSSVASGYINASNKAMSEENKDKLVAEWEDKWLNGNSANNSKPLPGLYDSNGLLVATWDEFETYGINIETELPISDMMTFSDMGMLFNYRVLEQSFGSDAIKALYPYTMPSGKTYNGEFANVTKIVVPDKIKVINTGVFNSLYIQEIILPNTLNEIGKGAFAKSDIKTITIPEGITVLVGGEDNVSCGDSRLFGECKSLTSVTIPKSVIKIEKNVFAECKALSDIYYKGTIAEWLKIDKYAGNAGAGLADAWNYQCNTITIHCSDGDIVV